jgi:hypothetical protein
MPASRNTPVFTTQVSVMFDVGLTKTGKVVVKSTNKRSKSGWEVCGPECRDKQSPAVIAAMLGLPMKSAEDKEWHTRKTKEHQTWKYKEDKGPKPLWWDVNVVDPNVKLMNATVVDPETARKVTMAQAVNKPKTPVKKLKKPSKKKRSNVPVMVYGSPHGSPVKKTRKKKRIVYDSDEDVSEKAIKKEEAEWFSNY